MAWAVPGEPVCLMGPGRSLCCPSVPTWAGSQVLAEQCLLAGDWGGSGSLKFCTHLAELNKMGEGGH